MQVLMGLWQDPWMMSAVGIFVAVFIILPSFRVIGPTEVGLVMKRFGWRKLENGDPIAFRGEAGYQAELLMPGLRWKFWLLFSVRKFPWVQVPAGEIGVVISQVGQSLAIGAKSGVYKKAFGNFADLGAFMAAGGQKGIQRPVLSPGTLAPIHPVAFLVITKSRVYGLPVSSEIKGLAVAESLSPGIFGLRSEQLELVRIEPQTRGIGTRPVDMVGVVTTYEGDPLPSGDIANRLGGFADVEKMEKEGAVDAEIIEHLLGSKNRLHNNYQDFQAFLENGGRIGLQHDLLLYGAYALNPFLIKVDLTPMLVVQQGEVAVIKAYVGLPTQDTSGMEFKFGSLVRPGHRGIWQEALRTGKYPINPRCYEAEIVPTAILTLNWAEANSQAHDLDRQLKQIIAKSSEGFVFAIDLQVQIHVPDTRAPRVISMVGTMPNLVNEVLQAAVGNHFRDKLQSMPAISFIETRQKVQEEAFEHIRTQLAQYQVETRGVYIQDVVLPEALVQVLTQREIAHQEIETFRRQKSAQEERIAVEHAKGTADEQSQLAKSKVDVAIKTNNAASRKADAEGESAYIREIGSAKAAARKAEAEGESAYIRETGTAKGAEVEAVGLATAKSFQAQVEALGPNATALVNILRELADSKARLVPEVLVTGQGGAVEGLAGALIKFLGRGTDVEKKKAA